MEVLRHNTDIKSARDGSLNQLNIVRSRQRWPTSLARVKAVNDVEVGFY